MMPTYRCMDSHPYQRNQMAYPRYYQPSMEAIPPQMNMDPSKSPFTHEQPWPYAGSYGYPTPMQFCCGHHNKFPPDYCSYRPAYPHIPSSSSPMYFSGGCPAYVDHFYVPYAPPPHYTSELPRYEYDKCIPREYHCCGCPNYPANYHKEGKSVKIEEHEPDVEKKVNNAVAPIQMKNYPYPFVWIPPEYTSNRELKKPVVSEVVKPPEDVKAERHEPNVWNGWFPLDINSLSNTIQDGNGGRNKNWQIDNPKRESEDDGRKNQNHQQGENNRREFPFPIIWMPNYNMEDGRRNNQESASTPKAIQEAPHAFKSPVSSCAEDDVSNRTDGSDVLREAKDEGGTPMKQTELHQGKNDSESNERRVRNIPVKQVERDMTDKESQTSVKKQSTSPRITSKLPPVCLRVDPLPKKKNGGGSSRSPSPPASKEHSQATAEGTSKASARAQVDLNVQNASEISDEVKPKEKVIKVVENSSEMKDGDQGDGSLSQTTSNLTNVEKNRIEEKEAEVINSVKEEESTKLIDDKPTKERKVLSYEEAAVLIQAAYRGFQVRKWELVKKLKQIAEVSKHVAEVKHGIQTLETSSDFQNGERQRITIGETIMRLLLKLDTIQGLHPSFREMRKSLARELTCLQEKLDSIMLKKSQQQMEELSARKHIDDTALVASDGEYMQEQPEKEVLEHGNEDQLSMEEDNSSLPADDGKCESGSPIDPAVNEETKSLPNGMVSEDVSHVSIDAFPGNCISKFAMDENKTKSESVEDDDLDMEAWRELPQGILDGDEFVDDFRENKQNETASEEQHLSGVSTYSTMTNDCVKDGASSEINEMAELPVGLLDDDTTSETSTHDDDAGISKEVLQDSKMECEATVKTTSSEDDMPIENQPDEQEEEMQSTEESDGWVKLELQKDEDIEENEQTEFTGNDRHDITEENACLEVPEEEMKKEELEVKEVAFAETPKEVTKGEVKDEQCIRSPVSEEESIPKHGGEKDKVIEENEKLREMMQKLLEAGNEQLNVISKLSGRVRELEKKLARKKKVRTRHCRPANSKSSCKKSSNSPLQGSVVGVM